MAHTISTSPEMTDDISPKFDIAQLCDCLGMELRVEPEILLMQAFSMMTTAIGPAVVKISDTRQEALCLYQMSFLEPSGGKTRSLYRMKMPFDKLESDLRQEITEYNADTEIKNRITIQVIKELEKKAAKNQASGEDYSQLIQEIADNQKNIFEIKQEPILFINPSSTEALLDSMEYDGAVSWCVAEGESFVKLIKQGGHETLLNVWNMERTQRTRRTSASTDIREPFLTLYIAMQPEKLLELTGHYKLQKTGLLSRFLFGFHKNITMYPVSVIMDSKKEWTTYCDRIQIAFDKRKENEELKKKTILHMTKDAIISFNDTVTNYMLRIQNDLSKISEWTGKLPSQLIRIAALFHLYEKDNPFDRPIEIDSMLKSKSLIDMYFIPNAIHLHDLLFPDLTFQAACIIAEILIRYNIPKFQQTEFHQLFKSKFRNASHCREGIEYLASRGVLLPEIPQLNLASQKTETEKQTAGAKGGRPLAPTWVVDGMCLQSFYRTSILRK